MSAAEVRAKAERLDAEIRRETLIGFIVASSLTMIGLVGLLTLREVETEARVIFAIAVSLVWFGVYRSNVRRTKGTLPADPELTTCLEFYRGELQRRRARFAKPPWFLVLILPVTLYQFVITIRAFNPEPRDLLLYPTALVLVMLAAVVFWRREARRLKGELEALDAFERDQ